MASNGRLTGGLESMLGAPLDTPEVRGGAKPMPPRDMHRIILQTLVAHGLRETAECLRSEADLGDLPIAAPTPTPATRPHRSARAQAQAGPPGVHLANDERVRAERVKVAACFEVVAEQRQRLDQLRSTVKQLRESRSGTKALAKDSAVAEQHTSRRIEELQVEIVQLQDIEFRTRDELRAKVEEATVLKELLSTKMSAETDLQQKVQRAKEEVARLRREKGS